MAAHIFRNEEAIGDLKGVKSNPNLPPRYVGQHQTLQVCKAVPSHGKYNANHFPENKEIILNLMACRSLFFPFLLGFFETR